MKTAEAADFSLKSKLYMAALMLANAVVLGLLLRKCPSFDQGAFYKPALVSPLAMLIAARMQFWRPRVSYLVASVASLMPAMWLWRIEADYFRFGMNSWIALNGSDNGPVTVDPIQYAKLRIIGAFLILLLLLTATLHSLPRKWIFLGKPLALRTWPAFVFSVCSVGIWFAVSVTPYREPTIVDAVSPVLSILHVEKNGLSFNETRISFYRDRSFQILRAHRNLFRYNFDDQVGNGVMNSDDFAKVDAAVALRRTITHTSGDPKAIRSWKTEMWYVSESRRNIATFRSSDVPAEFGGLLQAVEKTSVRSAHDWQRRDVCLGFCYDPVAGLGYSAINNRCGSDDKGGMKCF
jgi:hypothetical protein